DGAAPRGGRALPRARARRPRHRAGGRARSRLPPLRQPLVRARPYRRGLARGGDRLCDVLPAAAASPACAELPRLRGGLAAGDRAARARELLRAALGRHRLVAARTCRGCGSIGGRRTRRMTLPISRHRILNLVADAILIVVAWRLTFWIRFDQSIPVFYRHLLDWQ